MDNKTISIDISVPFPSKRLATIAYDVLRLDAEPKRSNVSKEFQLEEFVLKVFFSAPDMKQLRVGVNGFFENLLLINETIEFAGEPLSDKYSFF